MIKITCGREQPRGAKFIFLFKRLTYIVMFCPGNDVPSCTARRQRTRSYEKRRTHAILPNHDFCLFRTAAWVCSNISLNTDLGCDTILWRIV